MIDIDRIMLEYPDSNREEILNWIKDNPTVTYEEIVSDIQEGLFENLNFYDSLYETWKSNNNGQGLTPQQTLLIMKFYDTMIEYQQIDYDRELWNQIERGEVKQSDIVWENEL